MKLSFPSIPLTSPCAFVTCFNLAVPVRTRSSLSRNFSFQSSVTLFLKIYSGLQVSLQSIVLLRATMLVLVETLKENLQTRNSSRCFFESLFGAPLSFFIQQSCLVSTKFSLSLFWWFFEVFIHQPMSILDLHLFSPVLSVHFFTIQICKTMLQIFHLFSQNTCHPSFQLFTHSTSSTKVSKI